MEVWYGAEQVPASLSAPGGPGTVVTMGIFDGVHRGHQAVLGRVVELSHELARDGERPLAVAVTFDPHPRSVHQPEADLPLIASLTDRLASLGDLGLDAVLVITYTLDFAAQSPQDFVRTWLEELLGARAVVVGDDVRFGWHNSGDAATLEQIGRQDGFEVEIVSTIRSDEGRRWSSTWIRQCLKDGNMRQVSRVLGRPHRLRGVVVRGLRRGRELGFPTANLEAATAGVVPPDGVYAGWLIRGCPPPSRSVPIPPSTTSPSAPSRLTSWGAPTSISTARRWGSSSSSACAPCSPSMGSMRSWSRCAPISRTLPGSWTFRSPSRSVPRTSPRSSPGGWAEPSPGARRRV